MFFFFFMIGVFMLFLFFKFKDNLDKGFVYCKIIKCFIFLFIFGMIV